MKSPLLLLSFIPHKNMSCQHESLEAGKCTNPNCNYCLHEVKFGGLCALCGSVVEEE
jgi:hypothetical protein